MPSQENDTPENFELKSAIVRDKRWLGLGVLGLVVVVGMVVGVAYFQRISESSNQLVSKSVSQQTSVPVESVEPVEQAQRSYNIEILNGSGVTGSAGFAKSELESKFKNHDSSLEITTGNAPAQTGTTIQYKNDALRRSTLAGVLSELYPVANVSVVADMTYDIQIVLGK